jgi:hypothetical protein
MQLTSWPLGAMRMLSVMHSRSSLNLQLVDLQAPTPAVRSVALVWPERAKKVSQPACMLLPTVIARAWHFMLTL